MGGEGEGGGVVERQGGGGRPQHRAGLHQGEEGQEGGL